MKRKRSQSHHPKYKKRKVDGKVLISESSSEEDEVIFVRTSPYQTQGGVNFSPQRQTGTRNIIQPVEEDEDVIIVRTSSVPNNSSNRQRRSQIPRRNPLQTENQVQSDAHIAWLLQQEEQRSFAGENIRRYIPPPPPPRPPHHHHFHVNRPNHHFHARPGGDMSVFQLQRRELNSDDYEALSRLDDRITPNKKNVMSNFDFETYLPTVVCIDEGDGHVERDDTCTICLEKLMGCKDDLKKLIPCRHVFCRLCIKPWLTKHVNTCPTCKQKVDISEMKQKAKRKGMRKKRKGGEKREKQKSKELSSDHSHSNKRRRRRRKRSKRLEERKQDNVVVIE